MVGINPWGIYVIFLATILTDVTHVREHVFSKIKHERKAWQSELIA
jgi:hypothetical protein